MGKNKPSNKTKAKIQRSKKDEDGNVTFTFTADRIVPVEVFFTAEEKCVTVAVDDTLYDGITFDIDSVQEAERFAQSLAKRIEDNADVTIEEILASFCEDAAPGETQYPIMPGEVNGG